MILKQLSVKNFRNYDEAFLELGEGINIFFGNNAQGKTNLLESIYFLSFTKSHRSFIDNTLIKKDEISSKITGTLKTKELFNTKLEITLDKDKKNIFIDGDNCKKVSDYITKMNIIIFYPEDLDIIRGMPSVRRRYINSEISQYDKEYLMILNNFKKIQKLRNEFLKKINLKYDYDEQYLSIINDYFVKSSVQLYLSRNKFINNLNKIVGKIFEDLTGLSGFNIKYDNSLNIENFDDLKQSEIEKELLSKIEKNFDTDLKLGNTSIGPQKDDLIFLLNDLNIRNYGSQGQQRLAVLSLKLAEVEIIKEYNSDTPILLLDDVFSELDDEKKNKLLKYINQDIQTIITTTDLKNIDSSIINKSKLFEIISGKINKVVEVEQNGK